MVVVNAQPSTSTDRPRKNRRSMKRKKARTAATEHETTQPSSSQDITVNDDALMIDTEPASIPPPTMAPVFPSLPASAQRGTLKSETRRVLIPPHRMTPIKKEWINVFGPLTELLGLQVRMNVQRKCVDIRVSHSGTLAYRSCLMEPRRPKQPKRSAHCRKAPTLSRRSH
jgi:RNA-binding protein PNO1